MKQLIMAYQGEMTLKGLNRKTFEVTLLKTLRLQLKSFGEFKIHTAQSTIYINPVSEAAAKNIPAAFERCRHIFGIASLSLATICEEKEISCIQNTAATYLKDQLAAAKTFKVLARRADKTFPLTSVEIGREVGGFLLSKFPHLKVDVHAPQLPVTVEIREGMAYVHAGKQKAAGGLPVPTSGRAGLLLSGGIDSPVAGWQMAKRGLGLVAIHFASPPYTSPRAAAKVQTLASLLSKWAGPLPYYEVPYTKAQEYLRDEMPKQEYFTVIMRRSMMRIAEIICEKENCEALITGESLAQVASQTLQALACTNAAQALPVFRPCIGMDKTEITKIARDIGTFETSIQPFEDCCTIFTPAHPKTKPRLSDILLLEEGLPNLLALEAEAAQNAVFSLARPE